MTDVKPGTFLILITFIPTLFDTKTLKFGMCVKTGLSIPDHLIKKTTKILICRQQKYNLLKIYIRNVSLCTYSF